MGMNKVYATGITLSQGGIWREIPGANLLKLEFDKLSNEDKKCASFQYYNHAAKRTMRAMAAAIKFSDGSIWDNVILRWR